MVSPGNRALRGGEHTDVTAPETFRSGLFTQLTAGLSNEQRTVVLDIGPACAANIAFFSAYRCRLRIMDMLDALPPLVEHATAPAAASVRGRTTADAPARVAAGEEGEPPMPAWLERLAADDEPADIVLAWDSFNYLAREDFPAWTGQLIELMQRGAYLHTLIATQATLPQRPARYDIVDAGHLCRLPAAGVGQGTAPRYHQTELLRLMPGFEVVRSILLQDGWQEYLLRLC